MSSKTMMFSFKQSIDSSVSDNMLFTSLYQMASTQGSVGFSRKQIVLLGPRYENCSDLELKDCLKDSSKQSVEKETSIAAQSGIRGTEQVYKNSSCYSGKRALDKVGLMHCPGRSWRQNWMPKEDIQNNINSNFEDLMKMFK